MFNATENNNANSVPLVVNLDGALVRTNLFHESIINSISNNILNLIQGYSYLVEGKASLKKYFFQNSSIDYTTLPYEEKILAQIDKAKESNREVYISTASDEGHAQAIAEYLGFIDGYFASDGKIDLSGVRMTKALVNRFGKKGFDYIGNSKTDFLNWESAREAFGIHLSPKEKVKLLGLGGKIIPTNRDGLSLRTVLSTLRVHQYSKNVLLFVPLVTSHSFSIGNLLMVMVAFFAFSACASAAYIINDLSDISSDRKHITKQNRPFANGELPIILGVLIIPLLLVLSASLSSIVSNKFAAVLLIYFGMTNLYTFSLKKKMIVDIVVLSILYLLRIYAGATAIQVEVSNWLFLFAIFIFSSLALVKRYIELIRIQDAGLNDPINRNYQQVDLHVIMALAAGTGSNAITIFSLYLSSEEVTGLYSRPDILLMTIPILIYWIGRLLILSHRKLVDDDPIVFALKDKVSRLTIVSIMLCVIAAI